MLKNRRKRSVVRQAVRPLIEGLEGRTLLSVSLSHAGALHVHGSGHTDNISVSMDSQNSGMLDVSVNGKVKTYPAASVKKIVITASGSSNTVSVGASIMTPTTVQGGGGNDTLVAGGGNDSLYGGGKSDSLAGGAGSDTLHGGSGHDTLVAGTGNDKLIGGTGSCSLVGGAGNDTVLGGPGKDTIVNGTGPDVINAGKGKDSVDFNPNGGVALDTLPTAVQTGLTTLAQGATITGVLTFQEDGQTYYGTEVTINGVETKIVVDSSGNPVTQAPGNGPPPPSGPGDRQKGGLGSVVSVDTSADTITVSVGNPFGAPKQVTFALTSTTTLTADGTAVALGSLTAGEFVNVQTSSTDPTTATAITVLDQNVFGVVTAVDATANTITITPPNGTATTYTLNAGATVEVDGATSTLSAVTVNSKAGLKISALDGTVLDVEDQSSDDNGGGNPGNNPNQPPVAFGSIISVDTTADTITLSVNGGTNTTYNITSMTAIFINGTPDTLADLTVGAQAQLKLAADGITVIAIQSETENNPGAPGGPGQAVAFGAVASVDTTGDTITLTNDDGNSTTYTLTSTTTITLDGVTTPLSGLAAGDKAILMLASDGMTVVSVQAQTPPPMPTNPIIPVVPQLVIGAVSAIDTTGDTITLTVPNGSAGPFNVTNTTTIKLDGATSTLAALALGDKALVTLASDGVTVVNIEAETPPPIPTNPMPPTDPGENKPVAGPVASVDTSANTITLNPDGVSTTYNVTSTTTITLNGVNSTLSAIAAGDKALLDVASDGVTVLSIEAQTPPPMNPNGPGENEPVMGPVAGVDTTADTITLNPDGVSTTYNLTSTTTITLDGATSTLSAIVAGDNATLALASDGVTVVRIEAHSQPSNPTSPGPNEPVMGPVGTVDTTADTITLNPDGVSTTYDLTSSTTITLNDASSTLSALVPGTQAQLTLAADGKTVLSIVAHAPPQNPNDPPPGGPGQM